MLTMIVMRYNWIWKNEYAPRCERRSSSKLIQERR